MRIKVNPRLMNVIRRFITFEYDELFIDDRVIEYSFVISKPLSMPKGKVLDVGCTERIDIIPAVLTCLGWKV
jgi:hypothetical protein